MIIFGSPSRVRTCDLELRSLLLYPAELSGQTTNNTNDGAGGENRTRITCLEGTYISHYTTPAMKIL